MIYGRPTGQWVGLIAATASLAQVLIVTLLPTVDPVTVATIIGSVSAFLGVFIAFLAGQPPTVNEGTEVNVITPEGQPNRVTTV